MKETTSVPAVRTFFSPFYDFVTETVSVLEELYTRIVQFLANVEFDAMEEVRKVLESPLEIRAKEEETVSVQSEEPPVLYAIAVLYAIGDGDSARLGRCNRRLWVGVN
jgi:hypothetical protein